MGVNTITYTTRQDDMADPESCDGTHAILTKIYGEYINYANVSSGDKAVVARSFRGKDARTAHGGSVSVSHQNVNTISVYFDAEGRPKTLKLTTPQLQDKAMELTGQHMRRGIGNPAVVFEFDREVLAHIGWKSGYDSAPIPLKNDTADKTVKSLLADTLNIIRAHPDFAHVQTCLNDETDKRTGARGVYMPLDALIDATAKASKTR